MRSQLFVPGDSIKKMDKGLVSGADCLFIDLEDSVALPNKPQAREMAQEFLRAHISTKQRPLLYVRVNALDTGLTDADLDVVMKASPDGILLPKCNSGADVQHLAAKLAVREAENNLADGATRIIPIATETAAAIFNMGSYKGSSHRLAGITWGAEDLSADLGAETNRLGNGHYTPPYELARTLTLFAASAAGVPAIDTVFPNFRAEDSFRKECEAARRDGYSAKMAIHPAQVPIINEVFTPTPEAIAHAQAIINAFAANPEMGVTSLNGEMLDKPHLERAKRVMARVR